MARRRHLIHLKVRQYPWLNKADFQFDSNGQFKVNLKVSKEEGQQLVDQVKEAAAEAFGAKAAKAHFSLRQMMKQVTDHRH